MSHGPLPVVQSHRRALMATAGGKLAILPFDMASDLPASLGQFLVIERARERQRCALARQNDLARLAATQGQDSLSA